MKINGNFNRKAMFSNHNDIAETKSKEFNYNFNDLNLIRFPHGKSILQ